MNHVFRIPLLVLSMIWILVITSCSTVDPNGVGAPTNPTPDAPGAGGMGSDGTETIAKDLANTVDKVKGRSSFLPRRGAFFSIGLTDLERSANPGSERSGSDSDISNIAVGFDRVVADSWVAGTVMDLSRREASSSSDIEETTASSGSISLFVFSNLVLGKSFEVSGYAGLGRADTSTERNTESGSVRFLDQTSNTVRTLQIEQGQARGESNSNIVAAGLFATHRRQLGLRNQFILSAEVDFSRITTDAYTENGSTNTELAYRENNRENTRWTLSSGLSRVFSSSIGVLVPTLTLAYIYDNPNHDAIFSEVVSDPVLTTAIDATPADRNYGKVDLNLVWVRPRGIQFFGNIHTVFENRFEDSTGANIGARLEF